MAIILVAVVIRGTRARAEERYAESAGDGIVVHLHRTKDGSKEVRSSMVLAAPPERVWSVVTDYEHFPDIFASALWEMKIARVERGADQRLRLVGQVISRLGTFPVDVHVLHQEAPEERVASWDETTDLQTNRGRWIVRPHAGQTLLVYEIEVRLRPYPTFLINNVLLNEAKTALLAVQKRLASRPVG